MIDTRKTRAVSHGSQGKTEVRVARGPRELRTAFGLVYQAYLRCGLCEPSSKGVRVTPYHLLPTTEVFVAATGGEIVSTVSLVRDGALGLPMESIFGDEVAWRRDRGICVGEASCLADRRRDSVRSFPLVARLMSFTIQCARRRGIDELLIAVHPKHGRFYQRFLGFRQIAQERTYHVVQGKPAIAMALDMPGLSGSCPNAYKRVFGPRFPEDHLRYQPVPEAFRIELSRIVAETYAGEPDSVAASCMFEAEPLVA
jgi:hypothetical protein